MYVKLWHGFQLALVTSKSSNFRNTRQQWITWKIINGLQIKHSMEMLIINYKKLLILEFAISDQVLKEDKTT